MIRLRLLAWLLALAPLTHAQIPQLAPGPKATSTEETPEQTRQRLLDWLKEAREEFARLDEPTAETELPEGIAPTEFADRRRDVQQMIISLERHIKTLDSVNEAAEASKKAKATYESWKGFVESPPYSILWVDDLRNQRDVATERKTTSESTLQLFSSRLKENEIEARSSDEAARLAAGVAARNPSAKDSAWRMQATRWHSRSVFSRMGLLQALVSQQRELLSEAKTKLAFVEKQLAQIETRAAISDDDISQVRKSAELRQASLAKEIEDIRKRYNLAISTRRKLEGQVSPADKPDPILEAKLQSSSTRVESLQFSLDVLTTLDQIESQIPDAYLNRRTLLTSQEAGQRDNALKYLQHLREQIQAWGVYANNEISVAGAELRSLETKATNLSSQDPKLPLVIEQSADLRNRLDISQRLARTVDLQQRQLNSWLGDFDHVQEQRSYSQRFKDGFATLKLQISRIWNVGIWDYDVERIDANGQRGIHKESLPLGQLILAILLFIVGYWLAERITRRAQAILVARGRIGEAQSSTLRRWVMAFLAFLLIVLTLKVLNIPLTVFAFLGGALVIGVGFGTQTLIKNFFSGIIVLFERNIRVGDILDVGGTVGTVTEINTRSSVLKSADGVETLIPNSVFLENKIVNWTHSNRKLRRSVKVGVEHGSPVQRVAEILVDCATRHGLVLKDPAPMALLDDFGDNALLFSLNYWVELTPKTNSSLVASDLRFMIMKRFEEENIVIPSPSRDTRLVTDTPILVEWASAARDENS